MLNRLRGEFSTSGGRPAGHEIGSRQRDAESHVLPKEDEDMAGSIDGMADGVDRKAPPVERVSRVDYLDLARVGQSGMTDWGINLLSR